MRRAGWICMGALFSSVWGSSIAWGKPRNSAKPRVSLVVVVVIDQLASHYMTRWGSLLRGGLKKLRDQGAYYPFGRFEYANTETAPGHATVATGAWPNVHGVVANRWYNAAGESQYSFEDGTKRLLAPGIADALKLATRGRTKVVSIGHKDRAAIALGGGAPDLVAWFDGKTGRMRAPKNEPTWFQKVAKSRSAVASLGRRWERLRPELDYEVAAGPDDNALEYPVSGLGRTFPKVYGKGMDKGEWSSSFQVTPQALETLVGLAKTAVVKEKLGQRGVTDLLALGISSLDLAGHWFGTEAQETLDIFLRIDQVLGELNEYLDRVLGAGEVLFVITGDHGAAINPEALRKSGVRAFRIPARPLIAKINARLKQIAPTARVLRLNPPRVILAPTEGADRAALARAAAEVLEAEPGIVEAHAIEDTARFSEPYRTYFSRSRFPGREPDVFFKTAPHVIVSWRSKKDGRSYGTSHGSPHLYDMNVPIILSGPGVPVGEDRCPRPMTMVAPSIASLLEIDPPAAAFESPLWAGTESCQ